MKFTIIPDDGAVAVDGRWIQGLDLSALPSVVHAVHWDGDAGEVQERDAQGRIVANTPITDFAPYQAAIDAWETAKQVLDAPPPVPTLAERRAALWEAIKAERTHRVNGGVQVGDHWYHSDMGSRVQHMRLADKAATLLAGGGTGEDVLQLAGQPIAWKTLANDLVPMTAALAVAIVEAIEVLDALAFARAETLRAQIEASEDPESIDINSGWPAVYDPGAGAPE